MSSSMFRSGTFVLSLGAILVAAGAASAQGKGGGNGGGGGGGTSCSLSSSISAQLTMPPPAMAMPTSHLPGSLRSDGVSQVYSDAESKVLCRVGNNRNIGLVFSKNPPRRLVLSREWSLDVAQSICVDAIGALDGFKGTSEPQFRSWLFSIALNKIRMRHRFLTAERRDARRELGPEGGSDGPDQLAALYGTISTPSRNLSAMETIDQLEAAMEQLSEEQRLTLTMATVLGLSHREIAEQLGKAEPAVRKTLSRARARLSLLVAMDGEESA
jgi:RNA polymerase sigma-70 factor (ECF subfamily)